MPATALSSNIYGLARPFLPVPSAMDMEENRGNDLNSVGRYQIFSHD